MLLDYFEWFGADCVCYALVGLDDGNVEYMNCCSSDPGITVAALVSYRPVIDLMVTDVSLLFALLCI